MDIIDRVKRSAGKAVSKGCDSLSSILDSVRDKARRSRVDYRPDPIPSPEEDMSVGETEAPVTDGIDMSQILCDDPVSEDVPDIVEDDSTPAVTPRPVPVPVPLVRRGNRFTRSIRASSRAIDIDDPPRGLSFVGLVALVFASLYLMKLFTSLEAMQEDMSLIKRLLSAGMLLFLFYQYIGYVITIFQLRSGLRWSWSTMVRSSGTYVLLMILAETHMFDWLPFDLVSFPSWILMLAMASIMVYMMLPSVRRYYKPAYADMAPLKDWLLFVFWIDPYNSSDELYSDVDINIEL